MFEFKSGYRNSSGVKHINREYKPIPYGFESVGMYMIGCRVPGAVVSQAISRNCRDIS